MKLALFLLIFIGPSSAAYTFETSGTELLKASVLWVSDEATARTTYGDISTWDVGRVVRFTDLFRVDWATEHKVSFNVNISGWDTCE
jgi:hypothetical protein